MRSASLLGFVFALGMVAAALATRSSSAPAATTLAASVGPGFSISLTQNGQAVTSLQPGDYTIDVSDTATVHNFHLSGPGVDQATSVPGTGSTTWDVTLTTGSYHFQCDAHPTMLHGDFTVPAAGGTTSTGATTTAPPPPTTSPATTEAQATTTTSTHVVQTTSTAALTARLGKVTSGRHRIAVAISVTRTARATADLLTVQGRRLAHVTARIRHKLTLVLRPVRPLRHGAYLLRVRVTAGGSTVTATRTVRVA
jgi:plastocyanin